MEIKEGNKLIAEFFGLKRGWWISQQKPLTDDKKQWCDMDGKTFLGSRVYYDKDLQFHSSWDWLMPVVKKCGDISTSQERPSVNHCNMLDWIECEIGTYLRECDIQKVWEKVVEFVELYNKKANTQKDN